MKLKKSILIAPALGVMLIAAAGSVGGTVAWFTSNTAFSTEVSTFGVARLSGNLDCTMAADFGTSLNNNIISVGKAADNGLVKLTDASFDHATGILCTDDDGGVGLKFKSLGTRTFTPGSGQTDADHPWIAQAGNGTTVESIYYAVSWKMTFHYEFTNVVSNKVDLYFDATNSELANFADLKAAATAHSEDATKGFRIAFMPTAAVSPAPANGAHTVIWAPEQTAASSSYIDSGTSNVVVTAAFEGTGITAATVTAATFNTKIAYTAYTGGQYVFTYDGENWKYNASSVTLGDYGITPTGTAAAGDKIIITRTPKHGYSTIASGDNQGKYQDLVASDSSTSGVIVASSGNYNASATNYLGSFVPASTDANTIKDFEVYCVAWFEGSDSNVINEALFQSFSAKMSFFTLSGAAVA